MERTPGIHPSFESTARILSETRNGHAVCLGLSRPLFRFTVLYCFSLSPGPYSVVNADDGITSAPSLAWAARVDMGP